MDFQMKNKYGMEMQFMNYLFNVLLAQISVLV